jgi:hypothetical protein
MSTSRSAFLKTMAATSFGVAVSAAEGADAPALPKATPLYSNT